ncbi:fumarylacetoacetate hydrolase family protein [Janthinobacterium fluminis]|uniref:Fumarylacetoacetate hydrolase family protein n=1 Tax=Janthinobacterium fluminis TaxID=2987524 RepID=A0ABT5K5H6_9BURK|nr:fumarylacetoacetate hydrolase family protein [Janthinobacterium fluminis]MDC8759341.1 fumarylacetoacetate hydrolase family protein [Janthinobacterium fluminis]
MKLATLNDGTRDGQLAVVARDLKTAHLADGIAPTLQAALDDWAFIAPQLDALYQLLNQGRGQRSFDFDAANCMAPLPRACQWVAGAAYPNHVELACKAANIAAPESLRSEPPMRQGGGDFRGPHEAIALAYEQWGIDFEAGLAAITDDVAMGATPDQAHLHVKLLALVNDVTLRNLVADELAAGGGLLQAKPGASCAPVVLTPDELGDAWKGGKVHLPLRVHWNGKLVGQPHAGVDMLFNFPQLLARLCRTRPVRAGSVVGAGVVSNKDARRGYCCIAEKRYLEVLADGVASTPFMLFGDTVKVEMLGEDGKSLFGAIEQTLKQAEARKGG